MSRQGGRKKKEKEVVKELTPGEITQAKLKTQLDEELDIFKAVYYGMDKRLLEVLDTQKIKLDALDPLSGNSCIMIASKTGNMGAVKILAEKETNANLQGYMGATALHFACMNDHVEISEYLIDEMSANIEQQDDAGNTPICAAARGGHIRSVDLLCSKKANMEHTNKAGLTPFLGATLNNRGAVVDVLCKRHANQQCTDKRGNSALHIAAKCGFEKLARQLILNGADMGATNNDGETLEQVAADKAMLDLIRNPPKRRSSVV